LIKSIFCFAHFILSKLFHAFYFLFKSKSNIYRFLQNMLCGVFHLVICFQFKCGSEQSHEAHSSFKFIPQNKLHLDVRSRCGTERHTHLRSQEYFAELNKLHLDVHRTSYAPTKSGRLSRAEISKQLNINENTCKSHLSRASGLIFSSISMLGFIVQVENIFSAIYIQFSVKCLVIV
jgi:hypothetical protein